MLTVNLQPTLNDDKDGNYFILSLIYSDFNLLIFAFYKLCILSYLNLCNSYEGSSSNNTIFSSSPPSFFFFFFFFLLDTRAKVLNLNLVPVNSPLISVKMFHMLDLTY
jgi:hypothetical protein